MDSLRAQKIPWLDSPVFLHEFEPFLTCQLIFFFRLEIMQLAQIVHVTVFITFLILNIRFSLALVTCPRIILDNNFSIPFHHPQKLRLPPSHH